MNISPGAQDFDIVIVGAGPAGLCLARALSGHGLRIAVVDPQTRAELAAPAFDGREIALNHTTMHTLERLGIWARIDDAERNPLRDAMVSNETDPSPLHIEHGEVGLEMLGCLVSNAVIRRAAFEAVADCPDITWYDGRRVAQYSADKPNARVRLEDGVNLTAALVVAADGRFSPLRRAAGIVTRVHDYGRSMLVARVKLERPHGQIAREWFGRGQTLALLPLNEQQASVVMTLPEPEISRLAGLEPDAFSHEVTARYKQLMGEMTLVSERLTYPLAGVYPERFVSRRLALVGDAAVGMHPVTAHGFNLGVRGVDELARRLLDAHGEGRDMGEPVVLRGYDRAHRRHTLPLYLATDAIVRLYTDDRGPARTLRSLGLRLASSLPPVRRAIAASLADEDAPGTLRRVLLGR